MGIPTKIVSWLYEYLRSRTMLLKTAEGEIEREISDGLPQGCPLSPILFNLYTAELHHISNEHAELVQFADDFALLVTAQTIGEAGVITSRTLELLQEQLNKLNLKINAQKSATIPFTRKCTDRLRISVQGDLYDIVNTHQYLGYTLDRELRHRKHLEDISKKAGKKLGILKLLGRKSSGANPGTLLKVGNAIIRSRLEYGSAVFGNAAETNLKKIQVVQNAFIRHAMRYLPSTPVHVMLAEAGQIPMVHRIEALTKRELIRSSYFRTPLMRFISQALDREMGNGSYVTEMADKHNDLLYQVESMDKELAFKKRRRFYAGLELDRIIVPTLGKETKKKEQYSAMIWQTIYRETEETKYRNFQKMFTDGSKTPSGVAFAIYDQSSGATMAESINCNFTITNAELLAILEAVKFAKKKLYRKTVIYTDSRSACETLLNEETITTNYLAWEIFKELQEDDGSTFKIQWIPSHVGIHGNEMADAAALQKSSEKQSFYYRLTMGDSIRLSNYETWLDWDRSYIKHSQSKGIWHAKIMKTPGRSCWFKGLLLNPDETKVLNRLRSGHALTKSRRAQWGWETNDRCELCDITEDTNHVLYECSRFNSIRSKYTVLEYMSPLEKILQTASEEELKQVTNFIKKSQLQL